MSGGTFLSEQEKSKLIYGEENMEKILSADPTRLTMRGEAQIKRQHLNRQIFKNLRLRDGAEKMLQAREGLQGNSNKKVGETLKTEISFYDSRLDVLYNELANLKSSFDIYQSVTKTGFPMIAVSLKDTIDIDWEEPIQEFIDNHYRENPDKFADEIKKLVELRQLVQCPERNESGVELLYQYYNQLTFLEKRICTNQSLEGIQFVWYDALTAHQKTSKSIAFEKASVLFNIGVLWTQIAARKEFNTELKPAQEAIIALQKATGIFTRLKESSCIRGNFSVDLTSDVLDVLVDIFKVQAHECILNWDIKESGSEDVECYNLLARGAAQLSGRYETLKDSMSKRPCIPLSWITLAEVKSLHFKAIAHYYAALILLQNYDPDFTDSEDVSGSDKRTSTLIELNKVASWLMNEDSRTDKAKSHLKKSIITEKAAQKIAGRDRFITRLKGIQKILSDFEEKLTNTLTTIDITGDLELIASVDEIHCSTDRKDRIIEPEFNKYKVNDIFTKLGPLSVFNSKIKFNPPKQVTLNRDIQDGFGISIRGNAPTIICKISTRREHGGVQIGDVVTEVGTKNVKWLNHKQITRLIQESGNRITLTLLSPQSPRTVLQIV